MSHDDVMKWQHFPRYWPFVRGIHGWFPSQRPVTQNFDVFFDLHTNKRLSKQSGCRWFETPCRWLWPHSNDVDEFVVTGCTESCHFGYLRCSQWRKFRQNTSPFQGMSIMTQITGTVQQLVQANNKESIRTLHSGCEENPWVIDEFPSQRVNNGITVTP